MNKQERWNAEGIHFQLTLNPMEFDTENRATDYYAHKQCKYKCIKEIWINSHNDIV